MKSTKSVLLVSVFVPTMVSNQKPPGKYMYLNKWGSLLSALTLWGTVGYLSEHVLGRTYFRVSAYVVDFGEDLNR